MTSTTTRGTAPPAPPAQQSGNGNGSGSGKSLTKQMSLFTATAIVAGSIIGTGIFALPMSLAPYGMTSFIAFGLVTIGAIALALVFGWLGKRVPGSGGPYVYARDAFGNFGGFLTAWSYWLTAWIGNAAIAVAWVGYVEVFINKDGNAGWSIVIALIGLWIPAFINISGVKNLGWFQNITVILKFMPLIFMATIGLFFIKSANFGPFNPSGLSLFGAVSAAAAIALFVYIGLETASVVAGRVKSPEINVARATVWGTLACAFVYILGTLTVFGTVPHATLLTDTSPFSTAADNIFGGAWAGNLMAIAAIISGIGALNGWTLVCAEMPMAAANDKLFPRQFASLNKREIPVFGIVVATALASVITAFSYWKFESVFTDIVLLSVLTAVIPYVFSATAALYWFVVKGRQANWPRLTRDIVITVVALAFSFWALAGSGYQAIYYGVVVFFIGVPIYIWMMAQRREYGEEAVAPVEYEYHAPTNGKKAS